MFRILFQGDLFADYFQIYLRDEAHERLPDAYTNETHADRLMAGSNAIILFTARNFTVPVSVEWHHGYPEPEPEAFQHIVEGSLACPTGRLLLAGLTDYEPDAPHLTVPPGEIGVQVSFIGLDTLDEDEIDGDDRYLLRLWPAPARKDVRVVKRWPPA